MQVVGSIRLAEEAEVLAQKTGREMLRAIYKLARTWGQDTDLIILICLLAWEQKKTILIMVLCAVLWFVFFWLVPDTSFTKAL